MSPHSIGSGTISFGLVSIPIKLYTATSSAGVSFHLLHAKCGHRIRQQWGCGRASSSPDSKNLRRRRVGQQPNIRPQVRVVAPFSTACPRRVRVHGGGVKPARSYSRHGLNAAMVRVKLRGFTALDRRMAAAREAFAFKSELVSALGGDADLSPQRRRLIDMAVRAALLLDHIDAWLFEQPSLVNQRTRTLLPVLSQRQSLADHLARLLDRLGLDRVPQRTQSLHEVLGEIAAQREGGASPAPDVHQDQEAAQ